MAAPRRTSLSSWSQSDYRTSSGWGIQIQIQITRKLLVVVVDVATSLSLNLRRHRKRISHLDQSPRPN